jgi:hypothetical protein
MKFCRSICREKCEEHFVRVNNLKLSLSGSVCISVDGNWEQSTYIYSIPAVYVLSSELGLSQPLSRQRVCPSPRNQRGRGHTRLRVRGWWSPNSDDWRKLTLWSRGRVFVGVGTMYGVREELVSSVNIQESIHYMSTKTSRPLQWEDQSRPVLSSFSTLWDLWSD